MSFRSSNTRFFSHISCLAFKYNPTISTNSVILNSMNLCAEARVIAC